MIIISAVSFLLGLIVVNCSSDLNESIEHELLTHSRMDPINKTIVIETWKLFSNKVDEIINEKVSKLTAVYENLSKIKSLNISSDCDESIKFMLKEAKQSRSWAVKMINSWPSSLPASGVFEGTFSDFGSYHQCKDVLKVSSTQSIRSMYFMVNFKPLLSTRPRFHNIHEKIPDLEQFYESGDIAISSFASTAQYFYYTSFRIGICLPIITDIISNLPLKCSLNDVHQLAQKVGLNYAIQGQAMSCEEFGETKQFDAYQIVSIVIIAICILLALIGTTCHLFCNDDSLQVKLLSAFSIVKNTRSIFSKSKSQFACLNGIRVLSLCWIIFGHLMLWSHREQFSRTFNILSIVDPVISVGLVNGLVSVDSFFLVSGFLTSYVTMTATSGRREKFSVFWYFASRYIRLTPGLILAVCLLIITPLIGDGPLWKETFDPLVSSCHENWWINLFYLQGYVNSEKVCLLPTWWLSVDMTYHFVALLVIIIMYRNKKLGLFLVAMIILISAALTARTNYTRGFPPAIIWNMPHVEEQWTEMVRLWFWSPEYHASAYFVGLLLGYLLYFRNISMIKSKLTKTHLIIGWTFAFIALLSVQYINVIWHYGHTTWNQTFSAVWSSMSVMFWSLGVGWIILTCSTIKISSNLTFTSLINSILCWSVFRPLARVSYMVYLTHMLLIWYYSASRSSLIEMSSMTGIYIFISHVFFSYLFGFICTILVESPFIEIQKILLNNNIKMKEMKKNVCDEDNNENEVINLNNVG